MSYFVIAYLLVLCGTLAYLARLGAGQRRLEQAVRSLELELQQSSARKEPPDRKAA